MASKLIRWGKYLLVPIIAGLILYWVRFAPVPVVAHKVTRGEITSEVMGTGTLEARVQTVVSSKISGRIDRTLVDQGDWVKAGQVLLRLDDAELNQQVEIARSSLSAAKASVDRYQADADRAHAVLDQIKKDHERNQRLFVGKSISANEIEKSQKSLAVAEADLASAKAGVIQARKNLIVAQNTLDYHLARLKDTIITAPFYGLILRRDREPGDVVVPGTSIFLLISAEGLWVRAWVDETETLKLALGQRARVVFRSEPDHVYPGKVARLGRETDRETRQFIVDVHVDALPPNWSVGQRAEVFIESGRKTNVILLPSALVVRDKERLGVFVEEHGRATLRSIKTGIQGRDRVEIIEGLRPGDVVVTATDPKKLHPGRKVSTEFP